MGQSFGRRAPQVAQWRPAPAPEPALERVTTESDWKPAPDPEFAEWQAQRRGTRWKTWGMAGLMVLGGPMGFLMPEGVGQWAGWGLAGVGALGVLMRLRKGPVAKAEA